MISAQFTNVRIVQLIYVGLNLNNLNNHHCSNVTP